MPVHGVDITVLENIGVDTGKIDITEIYHWKIQYKPNIKILKNDPFLGQKWPISDIFAAPKAPQDFFLQKTP